VSRKRPDQLEPWTVWLRDALTARGKPSRLIYDDKVAGDVLLLSIDAGERDRLVELVVARRPRGRAHLAVMATDLDGVTAAHDAVGRMHAEVSRLANAKRKFVHRIERMLGELLSSWSERAAQLGGPLEVALTRLRAVAPEAWPMVGVGFHTEVAGADDHHTKEAYPSVFGAAVMLDGRWRGLAWDPARSRWVARAATFGALRRVRPDLDVEQGWISPAEAAMGAAVVGAAAVAATAGVEHEVTTSAKTSDSWCHWTDAIDPCDIADCTIGLADIGNCVPDCGHFDCGGLDCSW
jgi:hypothetical protein